MKTEHEAYLEALDELVKQFNRVKAENAGLRALVGELADELGSAYPHGEHPDEVTELLARAEEARKP